MRRWLIAFAGFIVILCIGFFALLPPMMKVEPSESRQLGIARGNLKHFYHVVESYRVHHGGRLPESIGQLERDEGYLRGMTAKAKAELLERLMYPADEGGRSTSGVLASFRTISGAILVLRSDGQIDIKK